LLIPLYGNAINLKRRSKPWKTFLEKSFPNLSKNFNLKPPCGFSKAKAKPWKTFLEKSFPNLSKNFT
jgi:hypothetical protein